MIDYCYMLWYTGWPDMYNKRIWPSYFTCPTILFHVKLSTPLQVGNHAAPEFM